MSCPDAKQADLPCSVKQMKEFLIAIEANVKSSTSVEIDWNAISKITGRSAANCQALFESAAYPGEFLSSPPKSSDEEALFRSKLAEKPSKTKGPAYERPVWWMEEQKLVARETAGSEVMLFSPSECAPFKPKPKLEEHKEEPKLEEQKEEPKLKEQKEEPKLGEQKEEPKLEEQKEELLIKEP